MPKPNLEQSRVELCPKHLRKFLFSVQYYNRTPAIAMPATMDKFQGLFHGQVKFSTRTSIQN